jgi:hypothetical protein
MAESVVPRGGDESKGLHRLATGSTVGLAAGIVGLALPVTLFFFSTYSPGTLLIRSSTLIQVTAIMALAGAILFAISLLIYRFGFALLRAADKRFWAASVLCILGSIGVLLIVLPMLLAFATSDTMASCIQGAPSKTLSCLRSAAPLAAYVGIVGLWLLWLGGVGIVVGIGLASVRYREAWLTGGAALYALLLLGFIAPVLGFVFSIGGLVYPILALPVLVILAPAVISHGSHRVLYGA